jgi:flagellar assembly factor FliW
MKIATVRFGQLKADPATFIQFSGGVYGFPAAKKFLLIETGNDSDFRWLQSVEDPALAFLVTDPTLFYPEFRAQVDKEHPLVAAMADDYQLLAIVTVDRPTRKVTVNLAAPLAVHIGRREGCQLILSAKGLSTSHDLVKDFKNEFARDCERKA